MSEPVKCFWVDPIDDEDEGRKWKRADTGEILDVVSHWHLPVGAMYDATWCHGSKEYTGPDGKSIMVITPGGGWMIDSRASNCTMPNDNEHKCWVRHGTPPQITVDKTGNTCQAGAGSILIGGYHGFLRNGYLVST